jgi:hypothetical protein
VFENRVLSRIFGSKRDEEAGVSRKLHNEGLNDLCFSPKIVRVTKIEKNEMEGTCSMYREKRGVYTVLMGISEGRRPLGRHRSSWGYNIKMDLQEVGCGVMD